MSCIYVEHGATEREIASGERRASERERQSRGSTAGVGIELARQRNPLPPTPPFARRGGGREGGRNGEFLGWFSAVEKGWNGMEWSLRLPSVGAGVSRGGLQRGPEIDNAIPRLPLPPSTLHPPPKLRSAASIFFASLSLAPSAPSAPSSARVLEMLTP